MQPLKQVLYQIDDSGTGRMSYHDFYVRPAQIFAFVHEPGLSSLSCAHVFKSYAPAWL